MRRDVCVCERDGEREAGWRIEGKRGLKREQKERQKGLNPFIQVASAWVIPFDENHI